MTTELGTKTTIMTRVTKNLGWMLFLVLAACFRTTVTSDEYALCLYPNKECVRYKIIEEHWAFQLREYAPGTWATYQDYSADFRNHYNIIMKYLEGDNSDRIIVPMMQPIFTRIFNSTNPPMYFMSIWLPTGRYPEPINPKLTMSTNPAVRFYVRRIHEETTNPMKYFKEFTMAVGDNSYVEDDFYMSNYDDYHWELGLLAK